ncbi:MAG: tRNA-guanine transglycosylase DpdA [Candidatus Xenobiia bacterium LiM19]
MKYFFPDSCDYIDPNYDFNNEKHQYHYIRQRDDLYAHEIMDPIPYDGILVSHASIEKSRYTMSQRYRFYRQGVREYFRLDNAKGNNRILAIGDCGAFNYIKEKIPPIKTDEIIDFYQDCNFDYGTSIDHVVLSFDPKLDEPIYMRKIPMEWRERQELTLELAQQFLTGIRKKRCSFIPIGMAQGWSPESYKESIVSLQEMGYEYIGLGGMAALQTADILKCLRAIDEVRLCSTKFHLFGVTRLEEIKEFKRFGIESFDSTSPLRQAFKHKMKNYYGLDKNYSSIRVPQIDGNDSLVRRIIAGEINQKQALTLETECLEKLRLYDDEKIPVEPVLEALYTYADLIGEKYDYKSAYREVLIDRPWRKCPCEICKTLGYQVILFRGAQRHKRRGFHNLFVAHMMLKSELA